MEGFTPKGIIQSAEDTTSQLHQEVSRQLSQAGHKTTPQEVNPEDNSALTKIKAKVGDAVHLADTTFGETIGTEVNYVRATGGKNWLGRLKQRALDRLKLSGKGR